MSTRKEWPSSRRCTPISSCSTPMAGSRLAVCRSAIMTWRFGFTNPLATAAWSARLARGSFDFTSRKRLPGGPASTSERFPSTSRSSPRIGDAAPDFTATTFDGETVTLGSFRGRYLLIDFWATWCGPCVANLDALGRLHHTLDKDRRIAIVSLNLDDDPAAARAMLDTRKPPWLQAHLGGRAAPQDDVLSRYAISFIPTYILIAPDGKLVYRGGDLKEIERILRSAPSSGDRTNTGQKEQR